MITGSVGAVWPQIGLNMDFIWSNSDSIYDMGFVFADSNGTVADALGFTFSIGVEIGPGIGIDFAFDSDGNFTGISTSTGVGITTFIEAHFLVDTTIVIPIIRRV